MLPLLLVAGASLVAGIPVQDAAQKPQKFPRITLENITKISFDNVLQDRSLSGPQIGNFPDPSLIYGDGSWKAYSTASGGKEIPVATSPDAFTWTATSDDALPNPGSWVDSSSDATWAPDVQKNDDGVYVMYYTAQQTGGSHCIGAATSNSATGPFTPQSSPLICDDANGGVIDPSGYDDGVNRWILWKVDGNSLGGATTCQGGTPSGSTYMPTPIKIQQMARDALTLQGGVSTILDNQGAANDGVVEAPALYKTSSGEFVLFYSAHCYSSDDYDIEYAWSSTINGEYGDRGILLRTASNVGIFGPGGADLDPDGTNMVFHGRNGANQGGGGTRYLYSATISINGESVSY